MKKLMVVAAFLAFAGSASAAGYGAAGCGVGSMIFKDSKGILNQLFAAATNHILFENQAFGITTGTLGCDTAGIWVQSQTQEAYVAANFDKINAEMAQGEGEHLVTLGKVLGCEDINAFNAVMQKNYKTIVPNEAVTPALFLGNVKESVSANALSCSLL